MFNCTNPTLNSEEDMFQLHFQTIRICHGCGSRIEKSVQSTTDWHHEACRVMTNVDPEGRIFFILLSPE